MNTQEAPREFVEAQKTNSTTGQWEFVCLQKDRFYTVITHDSAGEYDPVMKVGLIPEPME